MFQTVNRRSIARAEIYFCSRLNGQSRSTWDKQSLGNKVGVVASPGHVGAGDDRHGTTQTAVYTAVGRGKASLAVCRISDHVDVRSMRCHGSDSEQQCDNVWFQFHMFFDIGVVFGVCGRVARHNRENSA